MKHVLVALSFCTLALAPRIARADSGAQALFDEGKRFMTAGDIDKACDRFERSQALEPAGGTLLHLAACREQQGNTATAWDLFNQALSAARASQRKDREQVAAEHIAALEPKLVRVRIVVSAQAKGIAHLAIRRDGKAIDNAAWGVAAPIDPGTHEISASAPGRVDWKKKITAVKPGSSVDVEVPDLEVAPASATAPSAATDGSDGTTQRTIAVVAGGVGVVGVVIGTVFGLRSSSKHDAADRACGGPAPADCPQEGVDAGNAARSAGNVSTIGFILGGAGLAAGAILWFTAPTRRDTATALMRGSLRFDF